ncbi:hypothetical protein KR026_007644, partial [Drosophila bipectinata]
MRVLNTELRLRFKNRKPRPFNRAASADDAATMALDSSPSSPGAQSCLHGSPNTSRYS